MPHPSIASIHLIPYLYPHENPQQAPDAELNGANCCTHITYCYYFIILKLLVKHFGSVHEFVCIVRVDASLCVHTRGICTIWREICEVCCQWKPSCQVGGDLLGYFFKMRNFGTHNVKINCPYHCHSYNGIVYLSMYCSMQCINV